MNFQTYLEKASEGNPYFSLRAKEARAFKIPYPLRSGWKTDRKFLASTISDEHAARLLAQRLTPNLPEENEMAHMKEICKTTESHV